MNLYLIFKRDDETSLRVLRTPDSLLLTPADRKRLVDAGWMVAGAIRYAHDHSADSKEELNQVVEDILQDK